MTQKPRTFDLDGTFAACRAYHDAQCAKYPLSYDGADRDRSPKFRPSYLAPCGLTDGQRRRVLADLRKGCAALAERGDLVDVGGNSDGSRMYVLATPGVLAEVARLKLEREHATHLAEVLSGEAEHYVRGSCVSLGVEQARAVVNRLESLETEVERLRAAHDALERRVYRGRKS